MEARLVAAGRGWQWLVDGFTLFRMHPAMWMALTIVLGLLWLASFAIPILGPLLFNLFTPALFAGLMVGCRSVENGGPLEISHLFAGFRPHASALVTIGGVYLVGTIVVVGIALLVAGGSGLPQLLPKSGTDVEALRAAARSLALAVAVGGLVYLPLLMLVWFAPPLVVFEGLSPVYAMRLSFIACLKNTVPFLVYGTVVLALWLVLSLPAALGRAGALLVVVLLGASIPVLLCSIYVSYRDIFAPAPPAAHRGNPFLR